MNKSRLFWIYFFLIFVAASLLRFPFIGDLPFDSDQAIVGLMAKHIAQGEFPLLYYGDSYGGILEPALIALIFHLFGVSRFTLHLIPFVFSLLLLFSIYQMGRAFYNRKVGYLSLLIAVIPAYYSGLYLALANCGYIEILWLGNCLLLFSHRLGTQKEVRLSPFLQYFILGFFGGLAWWTHPLSIIYLITCALFLFFRERNGLRKGWFIFSALGFLLGSLPFWIWNAKQAFPFFQFIQSSEKVPYGSKLLATYSNILEFFGLHLKGEWPIAIYGFIILIMISILWPLIWAKKRTALFPQSQGPGLLGLFCLVFLAIYSGSRFNEGEVLRYLLPFYSLFPLTIALFLYLVQPSVSFVLMIGILVFQIHGYGISLGLYQNQNLRNQKLSEVESALITFLKKKNLRFNYSPEYWTGPRLTFNTEEDPIFSQPFNDRYPLYTLWADASPQAAFVLDGKYPKSFENMLQAMGGTYKKEVIAPYPGVKGYVVYYGFTPPPEQSVEIPPSNWKGKTNRNPGSAGLAFDRNISTGWSSSSPQWAGTFFQIDLGTPFKINRLELLSTKEKERDFPSNFKIEISKNERDWVAVTSVENNWAYGFWSFDRPYWKLRNGRTEISFQPQEARHIKITLTGPSPYAWSIGELLVYEAAEPGSLTVFPFEELLSFLFQEKIEVVYADIGLSARLTHRTQGKIKCLQDDYDMTKTPAYSFKGYNDSYPYFNRLSQRVDFSMNPAFVVKKEHLQDFTGLIESRQMTFQLKILGDYTVFYHVNPSQKNPRPGQEGSFPSLYWTGTHLLASTPSKGAGGGR